MNIRPATLEDAPTKVTPCGQGVAAGTTKPFNISTRVWLDTAGGGFAARIRRSRCMTPPSLALLVPPPLLRRGELFTLRGNK